VRVRRSCSTGVGCPQMDYLDGEVNLLADFAAFEDHLIPARDPLLPPRFASPPPFASQNEAVEAVGAKQSGGPRPRSRSLKTIAEPPI
jgi:hypothetical protein